MPPRPLARLLRWAGGAFPPSRGRGAVLGMGGLPRGTSHAAVKLFSPPSCDGARKIRDAAATDCRATQLSRFATRHRFLCFSQRRIFVKLLCRKFSQRDANLTSVPKTPHHPPAHAPPLPHPPKYTAANRKVTVIAKIKADPAGAQKQRCLYLQL